MDIPITISLKGNQPELYRDLFGLGEEVKDPEILKILEPKGETPRYTNESATIMEGVTLSEVKGRKYKIAESLETQLIDYPFILTITNTALSLGMNVYQITDWILDRIQNFEYKIRIGDKVVKTREQFQTTLDEYIRKNQEQEV